MKQPSSSSPAVDRRSFLIGVAASGLPVLPWAVTAQVEAEVIEAQQSEPTVPEGDALLQLALLRFGHYLKSDEIAMVKRGLDRIIRTSAELRKYPLHNGDSPDCLFEADELSKI